MKYTILIAALATAAVVATPATSQTLAPRDAAAIGLAGADGSAPIPSADARAADLNKMMEIRGWQAGPSAGDAAARTTSATPMASDSQRAAALQSTMEIRGWQSGPSAGDAATVSAQKAAAAPAAVRLDTPAVQKTLVDESQP